MRGTGLLKETRNVSSMRDLIGTWWPIVLPLLAVAGSQVRTETIVASQQIQIDNVEQNGVPTTNERLARIETKLDLLVDDRILRK
jgi:hypothetical protein